VKLNRRRRPLVTVTTLLTYNIGNHMPRCWPLRTLPYYPLPYLIIKICVQIKILPPPFLICNMHLLSRRYTYTIHIHMQHKANKYICLSLRNTHTRTHRHVHAHPPICTHSHTHIHMHGYKGYHSLTPS